LRGLEDVPWEDMSDGRGCAAGIDELLRRCTDSDAAVRAAAIDELSDRLLTDDTVSEASAYAAPFLVELGASYKVAADVRDRIIFLLAALALASRGFIEDGKRTRRRWNAAGRELPRLAPDWITRTRHAVATGAPKIFESLGREEVACGIALAIAVPEVVQPVTGTVLHGIAHDGEKPASLMAEAAAIAEHLVEGYETSELTLLATAQGHPELLRTYEDEARPARQPNDLTMAIMGYRYAYLAAYGVDPRPPKGS
jgi:hypothetical protein